MNLQSGLQKMKNGRASELLTRGGVKLTQHFATSGLYKGLSNHENKLGFLGMSMIIFYEKLNFKKTYKD